MKQHYPLDPVTGIENPALAWANGNPATGTNGSYPPFGLFLDPQKEILAAQRAGGLIDSADGSDTAQLSQSISRGTWLGILSQPATVNDLTAALPGSIAWPLLLIGMELSGVISAPNTGPMTLTLTGFGTAPGKLNLVGKGGGALAAGDIPANVPFKFRFDGGQFRVTGGVASETVTSVTNVLTGRMIVGGNLFSKTAAGTYQFTVPAGVYIIRVRLWGGGGGGGGSTAAGNVGSGGAGGGYTDGIFLVTPGQVLTLVVGAGGAQVTNGGTTSIAGLSSAISATGGGGGVNGNNGAQNTIPTGGMGYGGANNRAGQFGGVGIAWPVFSGSSQVGTAFAGGVGGAAGIEGSLTVFAINNGIPGANPGDGGSGANNGQVAGPGQAGRIDIYY